MSPHQVQPSSSSSSSIPVAGPSSESRAAVIGAGIAGLSSATALRRAGWRVTCFEKSRFKNEVGAAITVPPNATVALAHWGLFSRLSPDAAPVPNRCTRFARASDLKEIMRDEYGEDAMVEVEHVEDVEVEMAERLEGELEGMRIAKEGEEGGRAGSSPKTLGAFFFFALFF